MTRRGFTLIEMLVTFTILVLLSTAAYSTYEGAQKKGRDADRKQALQSIKLGLISYHSEQRPRRYPVTGTTTTLTGSDAVSTALVPNYLLQMPLDPFNVAPNVYKYQDQNSGAAFALFATLETSGGTDGYSIINE